MRSLQNSPVRSANDIEVTIQENDRPHCARRLDQFFSISSIVIFTESHRTEVIPALEHEDHGDVGAGQDAPDDAVDALVSDPDVGMGSLAWMS